MTSVARQSTSRCDTRVILQQGGNVNFKKRNKILIKKKAGIYHNMVTLLGNFTSY